MGGNNNGLEKRYVPRGAPSHCCAASFWLRGAFLASASASRTSASFFLFSTQTSRHAHAIMTPAKNKAAPPVLGDEAVAFQAIGLRVPTGALASLHYSCVLLHRTPAVPNFFAFFFCCIKQQICVCFCWEAHKLEHSTLVGSESTKETFGVWTRWWFDKVSCHRIYPADRFY